MDLFDPFHPNGSNIYFLSLNLNPNIHFIHIRPHPSLSGDNTLTSLKQNHTDRSNLGFLSICASPLSLAIRSNLGFVLTIISEAGSLYKTPDLWLWVEDDDTRLGWGPDWYRFLPYLLKTKTDEQVKERTLRLGSRTFKFSLSVEDEDRGVFILL
ncbi:hypothetical protein HanPSC8_Chr16g0704741 [Helianthus annuus]|nr:hypothetical protein HanPSC8_Chr16g0704741 [Helianthus annuus]